MNNSLKYELWQIQALLFFILGHLIVNPILSIVAFAIGTIHFTLAILAIIKNNHE